MRRLVPRQVPLNRRQLRFIQEYLVDLNSTQAAIRAGYKPGAAHSRGYRLRQDSRVRAAIEQAMAKRAKRTRITADQVLREYARIAFADIRRLSRWGPKGVTLRPDTALSDDDVAAISEVTPGLPGRPGKLKLHDKKRALDSLARHLGLFQRYEHPPGNPALRAKAAERARDIIRQRLDALASAAKAEAEEGRDPPPAQARPKGDGDES